MVMYFFLYRYIAAIEYTYHGLCRLTVKILHSDSMVTEGKSDDDSENFSW
jgi:hypothetical protein